MDSNYKAHLSESEVDDIVNQILAEETQLFEERTSMFKAVSDDDIKRAEAKKVDAERAAKAADAAKPDAKRAAVTKEVPATSAPAVTSPAQAARPVRTVASDVIHDAEPTATFTDESAFSPVDATGNIVVPMFLQEQVESASASSVEVKSIGAGGDIKNGNDDTGGHTPVTMQYDLINNEPITEATAQALEAIAPEAEVENDDTSGRMLNTDQIVGAKLSPMEHVYNWFDNSILAAPLVAVVTVLECLCTMMLLFDGFPNALGTDITLTSIIIIVAVFLLGGCTFKLAGYSYRAIADGRKNDELAVRMASYKKSVIIVITLAIIIVLFAIFCFGIQPSIAASAVADAPTVL